MNKAAEYYQKMALSDIFTGEAIKQYNVFKLVIAIYSRIKDDRKELDVIKLATKTASEFRKKAISRLKILSAQTNTPEDMINHIKRSVRRLDEMMTKINGERRKIISRIREKDEEKAKKIMEKLPEDMDYEKKIQLLEETEIIDEVLDVYRLELKPKTIFKKIFH